MTCLLYVLPVEPFENINTVCLLGNAAHLLYCFFFCYTIYRNICWLNSCFYCYLNCKRLKIKGLAKSIFFVYNKRISYYSSSRCQQAEHINSYFAYDYESKFFLSVTSPLVVLICRFHFATFDFLFLMKQFYLREK